MEKKHAEWGEEAYAAAVAWLEQGRTRWKKEGHRHPRLSRPTPHHTTPITQVRPGTFSSLLSTLLFWEAGGKVEARAACLLSLFSFPPQKTCSRPCWCRSRGHRRMKGGMFLEAVCILCSIFGVHPGVFFLFSSAHVPRRMHRALYFALGTWVPGLCFSHSRTACFVRLRA